MTDEAYERSLDDTFSESALGAARKAIVPWLEASRTYDNLAALFARLDTQISASQRTGLPEDVRDLMADIRLNLDGLRKTFEEQDILIDTVHEVLRSLTQARF